jgi:hypothetical protein
MACMFLVHVLMAWLLVIQSYPIQGHGISQQQTVSEKKLKATVFDESLRRSVLGMSCQFREVRRCLYYGGVVTRFVFLQGPHLEASCVYCACIYHLGSMHSTALCWYTASLCFSSG